MVVCAQLMHIPHEGRRLANRDKIKGKGIVKYLSGGGRGGQKIPQMQDSHFAPG